MKIFVTLLLSLSLLAYSSTAQSNSDFFQVTEVGTSAASIAKGNIEGFSEYANSIFENPASMHYLNKFSASLFTTTFMNEVVYNSVAVNVRLPRGVLGFGFMSAGVSDLSQTDLRFINNDDFEIIETGSFDYGNSVYKVGYQFSQNRRLHWGLSASYFTTDIGEFSGSGMNMDVGVVFNPQPFTLSLTAKNILSTTVKYDLSGYTNGLEEHADDLGLGDDFGSGTTPPTEAEEELPLTLVFAGLYEWGEFDFMAQYRHIGGVFEHNLYAGGVTYTPSSFPWAEVSAGYKQIPNLDETINRTTLGFGLTLFDVKFNYAYESSDHPVYDSKHYFSLGYRF